MRLLKMFRSARSGRQYIALWAGLLLALNACSRVSAPPAPPAPAHTPAPEAYLTFEVALPANTPAEQGVNLVILDEVTGLALNPRVLPMQALDATHYRLKTLLPLNSVLKYRYERQGEITFPEYTADGQQVRYRLLHISAPMQIQDSVARWVDTPFEAPTGRMQGRVVEAQSGRPLVDMLITCAGRQTRSLADGSFFLENLPVGVHWMSVYAPDGGHAPFQQQVEIAPQATTPAFISLSRRPRVEITFVVSPPADAPALLPIRMAGNLDILGNAFADLRGGVSHTAANLPVLHALPNGQHTLSLHLPAGADLRYKYTLGDGYWNAERTPQGAFRVRRLLVPDHDATIHDSIATWYDGAPGYLTFDLHTPPETPPGDTVSLQLSLFGWMEPLPMWQWEPDHWTYFIFSPRQGDGVLHYRYCRNAQCGVLDASDTAGPAHSGHTLDTTQANTPGTERLSAWQWWQTPVPAVSPGFSPRPRGPYFAKGVAFTPAYHPSWQHLYPQALERSLQMHANWVMFSPTWRFIHNDPPVLQPVAGETPDKAAWQRLNFEAQSRGLQVALFPQPRAALAAEAWWQAAPLGDAWWPRWFEVYRRFALHYAYLAQQSGVDTLILGGAWTTPALPGSPQSPADAEARWRALLKEVRSAFSGHVRWALVYQPGDFSPPAFLDALDGVYVLWSPPLDDSQAGAYLDEVFLPDTSLWLGVAYPAAAGGLRGLQGCVPAPQGGCLPAETLLRPPEGLQALPVDLHAQTRALQAVAQAVETRPWVEGLFVRGAYPAGDMQDPGTSVFGKPAEGLLQTIFAGW